MSAPDRGPGVPLSMLILTFAAIALRLLLFTGRGHYVAFDEGWYLLLGRNLWSGNGYTLTGLPHVALSPLFPFLAGAVERVLGDAIWAGRTVAAVSSGLLVFPCWSIFRRLSGPRVACAGALVVALLPSMAPFVAPYWIGWDLWVGAEPVLHLFLFTGIALFLRAWDEGGWGSALGCGAAFALAYLARPEAIGVFGLLGLGAVTLGTFGDRFMKIVVPGRAALAARVAGCVLVFAAASVPYWAHLHDVTGEWAITGRAVRLVPETVIPRVQPRRPRSNSIETMLWQGNSSPYVQTLYSLDASGTRLANGYWGVKGEPSSTARDGAVSTGATEAAAALATRDAASAPSAPRAADTGSSSDPSRAAPPATPWLLRYARALGVAFPWYLWLFVLPGLVAPGANRRRLDLEALVAVPLVVTSMLIARVVAIDPRTQLFLAPLAAFYAARGVLVVSALAAQRLEGRVRPEMVPRALIGALAVVLLGTSVSRLALSLTVGSPHHVVAAENAAVGAAIRRATPEDATVMSFHPAVALFADRDWRVLPMEPLDRIVRYARTQPNPYLVLSVFYPPELRPLEEPHYLIVPVAADLPEPERWRIHVPERAPVHAFGQLVPMD